jgi:hypothetical protein
VHIFDFFQAPWLEVVKSAVFTASLIAAITPNRYDNQIINYARSVIDVVALNVGNSRNATRK